METQRILIADDETSVAHALSRVLSLPEGGGYEVEIVDSGEAALPRISDTHFDLLVTDLRMPGMSGLELLEKVHQVSPATRCILITAFGSPQVEERAYRLSVDAYLTKPFSMRNFVQAVQYALRHTPAPPQRVNNFSEEGLAGIQARLEHLRNDLDALGVLLLDEAGQLLTECGKRGAFDTNAFLALLGNAMAAANEVAQMLRDEEAFDLHFHEGKDYEIYTARITDHVFLSLILDRHGKGSRIGMVWLYLRRAIAELRTLLNEALAPVSPVLSKDLSAVADALDQAIQFDPTTPAPAIDSASQVLSYEQAKAMGLIQEGFGE